MSWRSGTGRRLSLALLAGGAAVAASEPFTLSLPAAEGNYRVTVRLGDPHGTSMTTVKAELRRLMLEQIGTEKGQTVTLSFVVNVRRPNIGATGESVHFKERERTTEAAAWDNKLTLAFSGSEPKVRAVDLEAVEVPTIFIAGDSTSTDQGREPYNSWGQMIPRFFKPEVAVANHGESGETARSFISEKRLAKIGSVIKKGDTLLIEFGHNDQKEKGENAGVGPYKARLKEIAEVARAHGATPVLITPINRRSFDAEGKITNTLQDYPAAVRELAAHEKIALIDLNALSVTLYESFGPAASEVLFAPGDGTHHSDFGSYEMAKCVLVGMRQAGLSICKYISADFEGFDPKHPDAIRDFHVPRDADLTVDKPYGN